VKKPRQVVLSLDNTRQLLNGYGLCEGTPLGDLWVQQCSELQKLEQLVMGYLKQATGPALVAKGLSRDVRRKGVGRLVLNTQADGRLHLSFQRGPSGVPSMTDLRKRAKEQGVDIAFLKTRRREILEYLEQKKSKIHPDEVTQAPLAQEKKSKSSMGNL